MENEQGFRVQDIREDADESGTIAAPKPPQEWHCMNDGTRCDAWRKLCPYCGEYREDVER